MPERLLHQFKKLEKVQPEQEWLFSTRDFLVNRVKKDTITYQTYQTPWTYSLKVFLLNWQRRFIPAPSKIFAILLIVGLISGTGLAAQAEYRPNRALYKVKQFTEKVQLVLTTSSSGEAKVYLKHVENRGKEALKLAKSENLSPKVKEKHINTVVTKLKQEITAAGVSLDIAEQAEENTTTITDLAKKITENTKDTVKVLNQVIEEVEIKGVNETVTDVIATTEGLEEEAIQLLIERQDSGKINNKELSEVQIKALIEDRIKRAEEKVKELVGKISQLDLKQLKEDLGNSEKLATTSQNVLKIEEIEVLEERVEEVKKTIALANSFLEKGDLIGALEKVKESNKIISQLNNILVKVAQFITFNNEADELKVEGTIPGVLKGSLATTTETTPEIIGVSVK